MSEGSRVRHPPRWQHNNASHLISHPYRRALVRGLRPFVLPTLVRSTTVLSTGRLGASVLVKCPTDTGSLAGKVSLRPSSSNSSRCLFSLPPFAPEIRTSIARSASASATSSGSSPSSFPSTACCPNHASFSDGVPGTCSMISSEILGGARPSRITPGRRRLRAETWNMGQSRILGCEGFFGSATTQLQLPHPARELSYSISS